MWPLPSDSVGITDLLDWRECPQRMAHGMRRHVTLPDGRTDEPPGHTNWTNAYGSAIHDAIHEIETTGCTDQEAVERVWPKYASYLSPEELELLREDMQKYRGDSPVGMALVAAEVDARVPLLMHDGVQVYFRFKIDALYRRTEDPTVFYQRDYKSSKHRKTQKDVDGDLQMWSYNFGIFELYPECSALLQSYEQLRFGNNITTKNAEQRAQMRAWLEQTVRALIADTTHAPKQNDWCPWCPLVATCDETKRATRFWRGKMAELAPMTKEGRKTKVLLLDEGDELDHMIRDVLPQMIRTRKHLEAAEKALKAVVEALPTEDREALGWRLSERKARVVSPEGMRMIHEQLGDSFYEIIALVQSSVDNVVGKPVKGKPLSPGLKIIRDVELETVGSATLVRKR